MKNRICQVLALLLTLIVTLGGSAAAEVDTAALESLPDTITYLDDDDVTMVIRPLNQPYFGSIGGDAWEVCAYLDYVEDAESGLTLLRFSLAPESGEPLYADTLTLTVGKRSWRFSVNPVVTEYDAIFQEDYSVCLTDVSLELLAAYIRSGASTLAFALTGSETWQGTLSIPAADIKAIWDTYTHLGGPAQSLEAVRDRWPCEVE